MEDNTLKPSLKTPHFPNNKNYTPEKPIILDKPLIIGYMSVDVLREYQPNLSQLKYLTSIPKGRLHLDLNHNIEKAVKRTTDSNDERISLLLKFILDQKQRLQSIISTDSIFISYRRTLISVMCTVYNRKTTSIVASLFNNCIYLYLLESSQDIARKHSCKEQEKFCAWGYKFEQYMLSDAPDLKPDIVKPVIENDEFSIYYYTKLGDHQLFYGAQIDGMLTTKGPLKQVPDSDNFDENLNFLRQNCFVELKTNKEIYHRSQEFNFKKYKLLRCWCQCYLADLQGLLVGYRNDDGIIQGVEWFHTAGIVRYCRRQWDPQTMIDFLNRFLTYVKESFNSMKQTKDCSPLKPLTLKFDIDEQQRFSFSKTNEDAHIILPSWYVDNIYK